MVRAVVCRALGAPETLRLEEFPSRAVKIAAGQRHYYSGTQASCAHAGSVVVTIVAGPLNYVGANPKVSCELHRASR